MWSKKSREPGQSAGEQQCLRGKKKSPCISGDEKEESEVEEEN